MQDFNKLYNTKFTVESISPTGVVKVGFSAPLREPLEEDNLPPFSETPSEYIFVNFIQNYDGYLSGQEFDFHPLQWDEFGYWCTLQLDFARPLIVSAGDKADEIEVFMHKGYFLREWKPKKKVDECIGSTS